MTTDDKDWAVRVTAPGKEPLVLPASSEKVARQTFATVKASAENVPGQRAELVTRPTGGWEPVT